MPPDQLEPTGPVRIHARTRQRAMDWSLVLASQGIEAVIENSPETGWALIVAATDYERAFAAIEQYRRENLRWPWRQQILKPGLLFDWASLAWVLVTAIFFSLSNARTGLHDLGILDGAAVARGEWWRLFTAVWLHADLAHLAANSVFGFILLGLVMGRYGTGVGLLSAYLAGVAANGATWLLYGAGHRGLGASGMVMGALGLLAVQSIALLRQSPHAMRYALGGITGGVMLFALLGLSPGTDVAAHFGGFVAGIIFGAALAPFPKLAQRPLVNLLAGLVFATLVIWPWLLALRVLFWR